MGDLNKFLYNPHVDTYSKYLIFQAIPKNLLIWGCETWLFIQHSRTSWNYFYSATKERYWELLYSK